MQRHWAAALLLQCWSSCGKLSSPHAWGPLSAGCCALDWADAVRRLDRRLLQGVYNGWVRNVDILNADIGIRADRCQMVTIESVNIIASESPTSLPLKPSPFQEAHPVC
jgi:hypothetical protein